MKEYPKMYHNTEKRIFNNNKKVYASYNDREDKIYIKSYGDVRKKINSIINANDFIYRTNVNLVIDNQVVTKKIIGLSGNNIVTIDNEYIPIERIKDIYK